MNLSVTLKSVGQPIGEWIAQIDGFIRIEIQSSAWDLMNETHKFMLNQIVNNIKRDGSTGNLVKNITCKFEPQGNNWYFWIGDIPTLNQNAKYWYWLNYGIAQTGRKIPPANRGFFGAGNAPKEGGGTEKWTHTGNKDDFFMIPKKPIQAINYIQNTIHELESKIPNLFIGLKRVGGSTGYIEPGEVT
jgi:hypothetical protein